MSMTRLRGAFLFMLVAYTLSFIIGGDFRFGLGPPFVVLGVAVFWLIVGYYFWPTITLHIDRYRGRGYTFRPSWVRVLQTIAVTVAVALFSLLMDRLGGDAVDWSDMRFALLSGAFLYVAYLPPRADDAPGRGSGAPNGTLPTAR